MPVALALLSHIHWSFVFYITNTLEMLLIKSMSFIWCKLIRNRWMQQLAVQCSWFFQYGWFHQSYQSYQKPPPPGLSFPLYFYKFKVIDIYNQYHLLQLYILFGENQSGMDRCTCFDGIDGIKICCLVPFWLPGYHTVLLIWPGQVNGFAECYSHIDFSL